MATKQGIFITFEGGDGSGKSTQARLLAQRLIDRGYSVVLTYEPGGTSIGVALRDLLLNSHLPIQPMTELLIFFAARAENFETVIRPALKRGDIVISDRFVDSSFAYQGHGKAMDLAAISTLRDLVCAGFDPDVTFLLDIEPRISLQRKAEAGGDRIGGHLQLGFDLGDVLEGHKRQGGWEVEVHEKIREGYLAIASANSDRWKVINGTLPKKRVANMIWHRIEPLLCKVRPMEFHEPLFALRSEG